ncbi:similar to Saccharomyces cerevisiae YCL011C GBP2 Poly(A+) RNA-binding protein, involved in the export of mRNAs from the nucleus to the cytoplasm [Maudiozyma saulgeensis]|uniref:Similar to Saccharomyces cerevisiae YCL011C GBP2 Poly(A+) RNA-binding protein, involved in the export of mRNAs from the nucleus to the cytoplasm n=1 Tax=Maudiozyma saulgeensis TaxID=1789683 RepID=A0A1X7R9Q2_9SACH|nr:similar to Saccharomyces cerevisiae YCL011C GBP2 Poly(A+) RNA-binding protein, involved in the export of mRNAs from the nucleus to the cytoplasm [Kazachstania saulgeensis]
MSGSERNSEYKNRDRSRSPVRRRNNNDNFDDNNNNNNNNNERNSYGNDRRNNNNRRRRQENNDSYRGSRYNNGNETRGRYNDNDHGNNNNSRYGGRNDYGRGRSSRSYQNDRRNPRFSQKGDYGPVLARELDSTYEEKVNRNYANSIFVGNLTYDCTPDDLRDFFSSVGEVVRADIITSRGHHRGMGTVEYTNPQDVDDAIRKFDSSEFMDRPIFVRQDNPPPESNRERNNGRNNQQRRQQDERPQYQQQQQQNPRQRQRLPSFEVIINNLPRSINWQALKDMFKECGTVTRADVELDNNGYSTGVGKVILTTQADMDDAIKRYNGYQIEGSVLNVEPGRISGPGPASEPGNRYDNTSTNGDTTTTSVPSFSTVGYEANGPRSNFIFCSNLPESTDRKDLYDLFETMGKLNNAELKRNTTNEPTGVAIVEYENINDADVCLERLDKYNYGGCDLQISYAVKR